MSQRGSTPARRNPRQAAPRPETARRETRQERYEQRREERLRQEAASKRRTRRNWILGGVGSVLAIGLIVLIIVKTSQPAVPPIKGVVTYPNLVRQHVTGTVNYPQTPPVGGPHAAVWQNCGVYTAPVPNEDAVHSLEHGAVWITYRPDLAAADVATLRGLVSGQPYTILSPYPNLPDPVVASAWGVQLKLQSASDPRLAQFIKDYEQGPQTPELGASCSGGNSTTK